MRKLVTLRKIDNIEPIPNADAIEVATVGGWKVVVKKGDFQTGDFALYFEIDSILPSSNPMFDFLNAKGSKDLPTESGTVLNGFRLRTIRLRGQVSQGLLIPMPYDWSLGQSIYTPDQTYEFEDDLSHLFGVEKYEKPVPASLAGQIRGNFPTWFPKTDQERVQNLFGKIPEDVYQVEEKIEGSSMTIYWDTESVGVTSRNVDLKLDQEGNSYVDMAKKTGILDVLSTLYPNDKVAVRGELCGKGIKGNIYGMANVRFLIFDIWINDHYMAPWDRNMAIMDMRLAGAKAEIVPVLGAHYFSTGTENELIDMADGDSALGSTIREGLVFKSQDGTFSFKSVSKKYLEREK